MSLKFKCLVYTKKGKRFKVIDCQTNNITCMNINKSTLCILCTILF